MGRPRQLLSIGHSYAAAVNRRLAPEMARRGQGRVVTLTAFRQKPCLVRMLGPSTQYGGDHGGA
jgi:hypothetical protein